MADKLHASVKFSAGVAVLAVDAPFDAQGVELELYEVDVGLSSPESSPDDLLATFRVDVAEGKHSVQAVNLAPATGRAQGKVSFGTIKVRFARPRTSQDGQVHEVPVLHDLSEAQDALHVELAVKAKLGDQVYDPLQSGVQGGVHFEAATLTGPVVALLVGDPAQDEFFKAAQAYWKSHADEVVPRVGSLSGLLTKLSQPGGGRFKGVYSQVNIITHATIGSIQLPITGKDYPDAVDLRGITHSASLSRIDPAQTQVVFRGCLIGDDTCLLNELSRLLKGCQVRAPRYLQHYKSVGATMREFLLENFFVDVPGHVGLAGSEQQHAAALQAKYQGSGVDLSWPRDPADPSKGAFRVMLERTHAYWAGKDLPTLWYGHTFQKDPGLALQTVFVADPPVGGLPPTDRKVELAKQALARLKPEWEGLTLRTPEPKKVQEYRLRQRRAFDSWRYDLKQVDPAPDANRPGKFVPEGFIVRFHPGKRTRIDARRILADTSGGKPPPDEQHPQRNLVTPNVDDPAHFGRSGGACLLD